MTLTQIRIVRVPVTGPGGLGSAQDEYAATNDQMSAGTPATALYESDGKFFRFWNVSGKEA